MNRANRKSKSGRRAHEKKRFPSGKDDSDTVANESDRECVDREVQTDENWDIIDENNADHHGNEFDQLCDHVTRSLAALHGALHDFWTWKDDMLRQALPSSVLLRLTLVAGKLYRTYCGMQSPLSQLMDLVRLYSKPWEKKSTVLKKLQDDCQIKQGRLNVALRKIELFSVEEQRMAQERRIMNWERLFTKVTNRNSHGRRWKFRIQLLKDKIAQGLPLLATKQVEYNDETVVTTINIRQSEGDERDEEADSIAAQRDSTFSPESFDMSITDEQKGHRRVHFAAEDDDSSDEVMSEELAALSMNSPSGSSDTTRGTGTRTPPAPPAPPITKVETVDAATWTHEKEYNKYLHVRVFRPTGFDDTDVYCTLALGPQLVTSRVFSLSTSLEDDKPVDQNAASLSSRTNSRLTSSRLSLASQSKSKLKSSSVTKIGYEKCDEFKFIVPPDDKTISIPSKDNEIKESFKSASPNFLASGSLSLLSTAAVAEKANTKFDAVNVAVHSNGPGRPMVAMTSIAIKMLSVEDYRESEEIPGEDSIDTVSYDATCLKGGGFGQINLACYWTHEERVRTKTRGTLTHSIESVIEGLGFVHAKTPPVLNSREVQVEDDFSEQVVPCETPEGYVKEDKLTEVIMKHAEEIELLQAEHKQQLDALTLMHQMQDESRWAVVQSETHSPSDSSGISQRKSQTKSKDNISVAPSKSKIQKQLQPHHLPVKLLGTSFPEDFLSRLEHFARESARRQEELTHRIRTEVAEVCEKQMASLHRLDTRARQRTEYSEVCLPALFMPTKTRNVFTPRAHSYFHPMGSMLRITQPPSVFKLPSIPGHIATLNLYNMGQEYVARGPDWLRQKQDDQGRQTMTPPPSNVNVTEL
ncbi:uncharacterized protein LOC134193075 isoform X2 [Corticium candelabrum]|uniref:uncharacterized protein LOC134193075 isoform X2 n=1 Tax=Corticium candelabrum TaxID=121492 RepID=UPI002E267BE2|nr:uncharacterized protein LOC134193075 isoform X2 [Corticium candelabrum]